MVYLQCTVILKPRGTGWNSQYTSPPLGGISMTSNTGDWITPHLQPTIAGY